MFTPLQGFVASTSAVGCWDVGDLRGLCSAIIRRSGNPSCRVGRWLAALDPKRGGGHGELLGRWRRDHRRRILFEPNDSRHCRRLRMPHDRRCRRGRRLRWSWSRRLGSGCDPGVAAAHQKAGERTGEQHGNQDSEAQRTDDHVERAGDLLGQVVAVDRIGRSFGVPRGERDTNGQVRDREDEQHPAEGCDDGRRSRALAELAL